MTTYITVDGDAVRDLRTTKGLSQTELSAAASISLATVRRIEQGQSVRQASVEAVAAYLGTSVDALLHVTTDARADSGHRVGVFLRRSLTFARGVWNDPVFSKVIAQVLYAAGAALIGLGAYQYFTSKRTHPSTMWSSGPLIEMNRQRYEEIAERQRNAGKNAVKLSSPDLWDSLTSPLSIVGTAHSEDGMPLRQDIIFKLIDGYGNEIAHAGARSKGKFWPKAPTPFNVSIPFRPTTRRAVLTLDLEYELSTPITGGIFYFHRQSPVNVENGSEEPDRPDYIREILVDPAWFPQPYYPGLIDLWPDHIGSSGSARLFRFIFDDVNDISTADRFSRDSLRGEERLVLLALAKLGGAANDFGRLEQAAQALYRREFPFTFYHCKAKTGRLTKEQETLNFIVPPKWRSVIPGLISRKVLLEREGPLEVITFWRPAHDAAVSLAQPYLAKARAALSMH
ncbi:MAG: helix-turn-helix domain-containing protein [Acidobacteriia bacterium]|nr:helix-turn-helix domain-containing protein [Terriglobia bacterium]